MSYERAMVGLAKIQHTLGENTLQGKAKDLFRLRKVWAERVAPFTFPARQQDQLDNAGYYIEQYIKTGVAPFSPPADLKRAFHALIQAQLNRGVR